MVATTGDHAMSLPGTTGLGTTTDAVRDPPPTGGRIHTTTMTAKTPMEMRYDTVMIMTDMTDMTDTRTNGNAPAAAADPLTVNQENPSSIRATNLIQMWLMPGLQQTPAGACLPNSW